jgi:hypothetical protein
MGSKKNEKTQLAEDLRRLEEVRVLWQKTSAIRSSGAGMMAHNLKMLEEQLEQAIEERLQAGRKNKASERCRTSASKGDAPPAIYTTLEWSIFTLACLAKPGRADEVLGDAEAEYRKMIVRLGEARARWWYRVYVARTAIGMLPGVVMRLSGLHKLFSGP